MRCGALQEMAQHEGDAPAYEGEESGTSGSMDDGDFEKYLEVYHDSLPVLLSVCFVSQVSIGLCKLCYSI